MATRAHGWATLVLRQGAVAWPHARMATAVRAGAAVTPGDAGATNAHEGHNRKQGGGGGAGVCA
jgi:hypothetical protein